MSTYLHMCINTYIYIYVYIYICVYIPCHNKTINMCVCIGTYIHKKHLMRSLTTANPHIKRLCMSTHIHVCMYACVCTQQARHEKNNIYIYIYIYACPCLRMYMCEFIRAYVHKEYLIWSPRKKIIYISVVTYIHV